MPNDYQIPVESQLATWAQERDFVLGPRIWRDEIRDAAEAEDDLEGKIGPVTSHIPKDLPEGKRADYIAAHWARGLEASLTVFKRHLLIPTGLIIYGFTGDKIGSSDDSLGTIEKVQSHVESGKMHIQTVTWYLGHSNEQWRTDRWPTEVREHDALLSGDLKFTYWGRGRPRESSTSGNINLGYGQSEDPFYGALTAMLDWNEQPATRCGELGKYIRKDAEEFGLFVTGTHRKDLGKLLVRLDKAIESLS